MYEKIFTKYLNKTTKDCPLLFHRNGKGFTYNSINEAYLRAWKKAGLHPKFSGSHQVRYMGSQIALKTCGSLEAVKAVTGHKSTALAEMYSHTTNHELNKTASLKMQDFLIAN